MRITAVFLRKALGCTAENAERAAAPLDEACKLFEITTDRRLAAFLAQVGEESGLLRYTTEIWGDTPDQERYERDFDAPWPISAEQARTPPFERNRKAYNLGNVEKGDGRKYCGHGWLQVTGRANHRAATRQLRYYLGDDVVPDFETEPERASEPRWAAMTAANFWSSHGCNALADAENFEQLTRVINGSLTHYEQRFALWERVKQALISWAPAPVPENQPSEDIVARGEAGATLDPGPVLAVPPLDALAPAPAPSQSPAPTPDTEKSMIPLLLQGLAASLIDIFTPVVRDKIQSVLAKHTDKPEIAEQMTNAIIDSAKSVTNLINPTEAVAAVQKDPVLLQKVEEDANDTLNKMLPALDRMLAMEMAARQADEASYDAAARRENPQDVFLTRAIVGLVIGLMVVTAVLAGVAVGFQLESASTALITLFTTIAGIVIGKFGTRYDHAYGSSRPSQTQQVMADALVRRPSK